MILWIRSLIINHLIDRITNEILGYGRYIVSNKNGHILTNLQSHKLSIVVFEPACCNASPQGLFWTGLPWALVGPPGVLWAPLGPCGPPWGLVGLPGALWAGPLWAPWALVAPPGLLWARPLWAPPGPHGPGPNETPPRYPQAPQ